MLYLLAVKVPQLVFGPVCGVPTADSDTVSTDQDLVGYYFVAGSLFHQPQYAYSLTFSLTKSMSMHHLFIHIFLGHRVATGFS